MQALIHAKISAKRYGGVLDDYLPIHTFMDSSKSHIPDVRHRALYHHSAGIFTVEQVFGPYITNSEATLVATRDIAEDHVKEDMGFIPTVDWWFRNYTIQDRMMGRTRKSTKRQVLKFKETK